MELHTYQIDNYVHIQPAGALELCSVVGIEQDQATVSSINDPFNNYAFPVSELQPIPLTEFWLKELSFTATSGENNLNAQVEKALTRDNITVGFSSADNEIYVGNDNLQDAEKIQYVHELQNYFNTKTKNALKLP